ncbi:MAG: DUF3810 domain-containing protein [Lachnospiraceae bacterium]|nr:DUF3810 domain-containing protein [Lachnospiraceae bacterium]
MKNNIRFGTAGIILLAAAFIIQMCARTTAGFATWYAHHIYPILVRVIGRVSALLPFSVVELGLYLLIGGGLIYAVKNRRTPVNVCSRAFFLCGILLFSYTCCCGINYYAAPFSSYAGLQTGLYTTGELKELCSWLLEQVNASVSEEHYAERKREWKTEGVRAMKKAGEEFDCLSGYYPVPKEVTCSYILSVQQLCGIYSPFTIEANFNGDMPDYNIPHTICHELSHLKGFMREDEANFIGYLACISSDCPAFRYSGYLTGWVYAGNALARADIDIYMELRQKLDPRAEEDLQENNAFWGRYEGKVAEVSNQWNDTYLKMNDQEDGVKSYGRMVDLMLAYRKNTK